MFRFINKIFIQLVTSIVIAPNHIQRHIEMYFLREQFGKCIFYETLFFCEVMKMFFRRITF